MGLDWGWSLGSNGGGGGAGTQADTSGSGILQQLMGGGNKSSGNPSFDGTTATGSSASGVGTGNSSASSVQGTGIPGNVPGSPADNAYYHWQGGAANPNQPPNQNLTGGRYVDPTYQHDATGRQLTPDEQAFWKNQDTLRAQAGSIARSNQVGGTTTSANGQKIIYDDRSKTWSLMNPGTKAWTSGIATKDIYGQLTGNLKDENPEWYYGQAANSADMARTYELNRDNNIYQGQQQGDRQQVKYPTFGL